MLSIGQFIQSIRQPKPHIVKIFEELRSADEQRKAELKTKLFSFTPAVIVTEKRAYKYIDSFTGLLPLDFDKIDNSLEFKQYLFDEYKFIVACWLSSSKRGVRALVRIPVVNTVDEFKLFFSGLAFYYMDAYNGFDHATQNPVLPMFQSYDPEILYRENAETWDRIYIKPEPQKREQFKSSQSAEIIVKKITKAVDKISGNGHPQLRAAAYTLGGYVGSGAISYQEAENLMIYLIHSNEYLSIKPSVYIRTAKEMINKGTLQPL